MGANLTDSKTSIMALQSHRPDDLGTGLVDLLPAACVCQCSACVGPPQHFYSHEECTFLDTLLDAVDGTPKLSCTSALPHADALHRGLTTLSTWFHQGRSTVA